MLAHGARLRGLAASGAFLAAALLALAVCFGMKAWADGEAAAASSEDGYYAQMSVTAPVQVKGTLDPVSGEVTFPDAEVTNNSAYVDAKVDTAAFSAAEGVSGVWTVGVGDKTAQLGVDGTAKELGASLSRGASASMTLDTTYGGFAAGKMIDKSLGTLTLTFSEDAQAFAVYSDDDKSLDFYKRGSLPAVGDTYRGKVATAVYTGIEKDTYHSAPKPWRAYQSNITSVSVIDEGIAPISTASWFSSMSNMTSCDIGKLDTSKVTDMRWMFTGCSSITSLDVSKFNTSQVTDMGYMFRDCAKIASLDLSSFDTANVMDMETMFYGCSSLASLDLSSFDTSKVTDMGYMFHTCSSLATIDVSRFDTSSVTSMSAMFYRCSSLTALNLSGFDTSSVTDMSWMFYACSSLASLDVSSFDTSKVTNTHIMFSDCSKLTSVSLGEKWKWVGTDGYLPAPSSTYITGADGKWYDEATGTGYAPEEVPPGAAAVYVARDPKTVFAVYSDDDKSLDFYKRAGVPAAGDTFRGKAATAVYTGIEKDRYSTNTVPWKDYRSTITNVNIVDNGIKPVSTAYWFYRFDKLTICDASKLDTSKVRDMSNMFSGCSSLAALDLSSFKTSNIASISSMFYGCSSLTSLDLSSFDTSKVTNMYGMFYNCSSLASLDLSSFDTSKVTNMGSLFSGCSSLAVLDISGFDTSKVTYMASMLYECSSLAALDLSSFDTSKVTDMSNMFSGCSSLAALDLSSFDTSNIASISSMFYGCSSLTSLDLSSFDTSKVTNMYGMFYGCSKLGTVSLGANFKWVGTDGHLPTPSPTYIAGADGKWYADSDGSGYEPADVPGGKADTYCAAATQLPMLVGNASLSIGGEASPQIDCSFTTPQDVEPSYAWYREGSLVAGASGATLPLSEADFGHSFECRVADASGVKTGHVSATIEVPAAKTYTLDANGGAFSDGSTTAQAKYLVADGSVTKYSHTPNIDDEGNASGTYAANLAKNDVVTIPGATELTIDVWYSTESTSYDWLAIYPGGVTPSASNYSSATISGGKLGGGAKMTKDGASHATFTVAGDTAQFFFRSDGSGQYYGYYAVVSADASKTFKLSGPDDPVRGNGDFELTGWNTSKDGSGDAFGAALADGSTVYAQWRDVRQAFAVYSADDGSLDFYKRGVVPSTGDTFCGKDATQVYTEIETRTFYSNTQPWKSRSSSIQSVTVVDEGITPISTQCWFSNLGKMISCDIGKLNTSKATSMGLMFTDCSSLESLDMSSFDTSNVTNMNTMFSSCSSLTAIDVSGWDTSKVTNTSSMFNKCSSLTTLDVSSFDLSKVSNTSYMFNGCSSLTTLTSPASGPKSATNMSSMFSDCSSLKSLDLSSFDTSNATNMSSMFYKCSALTVLDLSSFDMSKVTNANYMFAYCFKLANVSLGEKWKWVGTNGYLPTPSSAYISGADGKWYAEDGTSYAPADVPDGAGTYYAAALSGSLTVSGDAAVGGTLTASVTGAQSDADLAYEWVRTKQEETTEHIEFTGETITRTIEVTSAPATLKFENVGPITSTQSAESVISPQAADVSSIGFRVTNQSGKVLTGDGSDTWHGWEALGDAYVGYNSDTYSITDDGIYTIEIGSVSGDQSGTMTENIQVDMTYPQSAAALVGTESTYSPTAEDLGTLLSCHARDAAGLYYGSLESAAATVGKGAMTLTASVSGERYCGSQLTCDVAGAPVGATLSYQWQYAQAGSGNWVDSAQSDATSRTFTPNDTWDGFDCRCKVSATCAGYEDATAYSDAARITANPMPSVTADAATWTLAQQKAVAEDISTNGTESQWYARAKAAMDDGVQWTVDLTDGTTLTYRIIGILHDDKSDGSGKAGLTFQATHSLAKAYAMNDMKDNSYGWKMSKLRTTMNSGEIWNLLPSGLQSSITSVDKLTNNEGGGLSSAAVTTTSDKLFLLSYAEYVPTSYWASSYPWTAQEGSQYEAWAANTIEDNADNSCLAYLYKTNEGKTPSGSNSAILWERSVFPTSNNAFLAVNASGNPADGDLASFTRSVSPAWCF